MNAIIFIQVLALSHRAQVFRAMQFKKQLPSAEL